MPDPEPNPPFWKPTVSESLRYRWIFALPAILTNRTRSLVRYRPDPFCIHCGYSLLHLPDHHTCPECGYPYSFLQIEEYRRDPDWFIQRWNLRHEIPPPETPFNAGPRSRRKSRDGT